MKILITGSTGFVGRHLVIVLLRDGHQVTGVGRSSQPGINTETFDFIQADTTRPGKWQDRIREMDGVINLAGANIFKRWTSAYKQDIYDSRILTTRHLVEALPEDGAAGRFFCSTSAAGYYGDRGDETLTEESTPGDDFLATVCVDWEAEAKKAEDKGYRVVIPRFGVILGQDGGALEKMVPAYRLFLGGKLGDGRQWFPWMHLEDLINALIFVAQNETLQGPVNFCAPNPVRNADFSKTLADHLGRPSLFQVPRTALNLAAGELGTLVLNSQRAVPEKLTAAGFDFQYPTLEEALHDLV